MKTGERPPAAVEAHVAPAGKASATVEASASTMKASTAEAACVEASASTVASATLRKSGLRQQTDCNRPNDRQ
jgi:hypothetical protein